MFNDPYQTIYYNTRQFEGLYLYGQGFTKMTFHFKS